MARISTGKGQIELNNVAFRRDGRIEAQCKLTTAAENGMILVIDKAAGTCTPGNTGDVMGINYSSEHMYDQFHTGLENFSLAAGEYPRIGLLSVGDIFTTNCADGTLSGAKYANPNTSGVWALATSKPESAKIIAKVVEATTMPDGKAAVKLQIIAC